MLSVIIPAFNEEAMIPITAKTIAGILQKEQISYELIFVNDGSRDETWNRVKEAAAQDKQVRGISFSRNGRLAFSMT